MTIEITRSELETKIGGDRFTLVEALPAPYYASGHLPGAKNLPLDAIPERAGEILPDKEGEVVVYCSGPSCQNSHVAQRKLASLGYQRVRVFAGGKSDWTAAGNALVKS